MNNKEYSPFTPGSPVPIELFVGRSKQISELLRYARQIKSGKKENVFLAGERGIGKSSLASFIKYYLNTNENILGIHVFLGGVTSLNELVKLIFDKILKETKEKGWFDDIANFFGKRIKEIGLFGISVSFDPSEEDLQKLVINFPEALANLIKNLKKQKQGLFIALDDINGLVEQSDFANWYKSFVDRVATHYDEFPVFFVLIGLPEKRDVLARKQPSLMRIFRVVEIEKLDDREVQEFFIKAYTQVGMKVTEEALKLMVKYSSGLPLLMHEIGDSTFWIDTDGEIDADDAFKGVLSAAEKIGQKYLDPKVYKAIRSERYRSILRKLGEQPFKRSFFKKEIEKKLNDNEKGVFHNFLRRIRDLGVIEPDIERGRGSYRFVNEIYPLYIYLESQRYRKKFKT